MNYDEYKEHQRIAQTRRAAECLCVKCENYRRTFADELDAEQAAKGDITRLTNPF